jgi:pimeloyl-ACP methyl ester carboxylesterase
MGLASGVAGDATMPAMTIPRLGRSILAASALCAAADGVQAMEASMSLQPCSLAGLTHGARCGHLQRPLDPARPDGKRIEIQLAVLPALARHKKPDPIFFFAGGPGQSAIGLAGTVSRLFSRLGQRRDIVLIDQRGTGRSAPLKCADDSRPSLVDAADTARQLVRLHDCRVALEKLAWGDLTQFTTTAAVADADAVRAALGFERVDLIGGSYGTRVVIEYQRQFPQRVRRAVIDGVAPPDMALPASFSFDNQAALDALLRACADDPGCAARHPRLQAEWQGLLAGLPQRAVVADPVTGREAQLTLTRDSVLAMVRAPLYAPSLASAIPQAIHDAAAGRFNGLAALSSALNAGGEGLATGMHFSVVCSEDLPRMAANRAGLGADFGSTFGDFYGRACADWPQARVPPDFYRIGPAPSATLVLSGGDDPATPPRHGERVAHALGAMAKHQVVGHAGHGVMGLACMDDVVFRFIDAESDADALKVDTACAAAIPRPTAFMPPGDAPVVTGRRGGIHSTTPSGASR